MQYLLLIYVDEAERALTTPEEMAAGYAEHGVLNARLDQKKARIFAAELQPPSTATTVRNRNGESVITDGPFAETTEHLRGFYIVEAADMDEAASYARMIGDTIEIRPQMEQCTLDAQESTP